MNINLKSVLQNYPTAGKSRANLQGYLRDLYPREKRDINLLLSVWDCGAAEEIRGMNQLDNVQMKRLVNRLDKEYGTSERFAREALILWAEAYGVTVTAVNGPSAENDPSATNGPAAERTEKGTAQTKASVDAQTPDSTSATFRHASANAGDYITFGRYEQHNSTATGTEEIEWLVLAKKTVFDPIRGEDNRILAVSKYALDVQPYNEEAMDVTWETCSLRSWLNGDFLNKAFSAAEQTMIPAVKVTADKNPQFDADPGKTTRDRVFLLSIAEVSRYFSSDEARKCAPTPYAVDNFAYTSDSNTVGGAATGWWWLRSPGNINNNAAGVSSDGSVSNFGMDVGCDVNVVRPALWISY